MSDQNIINKDNYTLRSYKQGDLFCAECIIDYFNQQGLDRSHIEEILEFSDALHYFTNDDISVSCSVEEAYKGIALKNPKDADLSLDGFICKNYFIAFNKQTHKAEYFVDKETGEFTQMLECERRLRNTDFNFEATLVFEFDWQGDFYPPTRTRDGGHYSEGKLHNEYTENFSNIVEMFMEDNHTVTYDLLYHNVKWQDYENEPEVFVEEREEIDF